MISKALHNKHKDNMHKVPCTLYRAGTSKGPFFLKNDLPSDTQLRNKMLLSIMGSPHSRQIDGIGGADSLSSKVAIISSSVKEEVDIDYLFCQVHIDIPSVNTALNCGNMLSAVAPFAIEKGLVKAVHPETTVKIFNENTGSIVHALVQTPGGKISYSGNTIIDGVPGSAAPIKLTFLDSVGSNTGTLLPTGNVIDRIEGINVSCIDVAVPMVILCASSLGKTGYESKKTLDADKEFLKNLETIRQKAALKMGLGNVSSNVSPKVCLIAPPRHGGQITSRYFTPFDCHATHAVTGALCLSAACLIPGTLAHNITKFPLPTSTLDEYEIEIEHPAGKIQTAIKTTKENNKIDFPEASFIRTARPLFEGKVLIA
ncbi:MAG: hypothetical protein DHS20C10_12580 [marine bacterium B5-7]|nr:MAG: hypothetical protein DHS20C10_12580 [marine bacterium B5-7]